MNFFILWSTIMHWVPLVESKSGQKILWSSRPFGQRNPLVKNPLVKKPLVNGTLVKSTLWSKDPRRLRQYQPSGAGGPRSQPERRSTGTPTACAN